MPEKKEIEKTSAKSREGEIVMRRPSDIFTEMDRMLSDFRSEFQDLFDPWRSLWPIATPRMSLPQVRTPMSDLIDTGKGYKIRAEMPGIPKDKIDISIDKDSIEINAEAKTETDEEKKGYVRKERSYSSLYRKLSFPEEVVPDKAESTYQDGLLEVTVPKKTPTEIKKHKVTVK
jgi:HSP20 family protein